MVMIAHASSNEHGKTKGGIPGDQTQREVCIRTWYNRPWNVVIRLKDETMRERLAYAMKSAADNNWIGYNQSRRNTLLTYARFVGYDISRVATPCETDCSALVSVACMYAGIPENVLYRGGNCSTTSNLKARLKPYSTIFTSKDYTQKTDKLEVGDILLFEGSHTAVVVETDNSRNTIPKDKSIKDVAQEVIDGKWGNGIERKTRLKEAGYDPTTVQQMVNDYLKSKVR